MVSSSYARPKHEGKTGDEWFYGEYGHPGKMATHQKAKTAFRAMGSNGVPYLIGRAQIRERAISRTYENIYPRLPKVFRQTLRPPLKASYVQSIALSHLSALPSSQLAPYAQQVIELFPIFTDKRNRQMGFNLARKLVNRSGSISLQTNFYLSLLNESDFRLRLDAAVQLSQADPTLTNGLPTLVTALTNKSLLRKSYLMPKSALSGRSAVSQDPEVWNARKRAHQALISVAPELAEQFKLRELDAIQPPTN